MLNGVSMNPWGTVSHVNLKFITLPDMFMLEFNFCPVEATVVVGILIANADVCFNLMTVRIRA